MGWDGGYKLNTDVPPCGQQPNNNNIIIGCKTLCVSRLQLRRKRRNLHRISRVRGMAGSQVITMMMMMMMVRNGIEHRIGPTKQSFDKDI